MRPSILWLSVLGFVLPAYAVSAKCRLSQGQEFNPDTEEELGTFPQIPLDIPDGSCPMPFVRGGRKCFYISRLKANWFQASAFCQKQGATLATIEDENENIFLRKLFHSKYGSQDTNDSTELAWTSAADLGETKNWLWMSTGEKMKGYADWSYQNPDNHQGKEHCMAIFGPHKYQWNDWDCNERGYFFCQKYPAPEGFAGGSSSSCTKAALKLMDLVHKVFANEVHAGTLLKIADGVRKVTGTRGESLFY